MPMMSYNYLMWVSLLLTLFCFFNRIFLVTPPFCGCRMGKNRAIRATTAREVVRVSKGMSATGLNRVKQGKKPLRVTSYLLGTDSIGT